MHVMSILGWMGGFQGGRPVRTSVEAAWRVHYLQFKVLRSVYMCVCLLLMTPIISCQWAFKYCTLIHSLAILLANQHNLSLDVRQLKYLLQ